MKKISRIPKIITLIEDIWLKNSDLRLCQLINNCFNCHDTYYVEDDELESKLKEYYNV